MRPDTPPQIRPATPDDAEALQDLYAHLSSDNTPCALDRARHNIAQIAKYDGSAILAAEKNGLLLATCTLIVIPNLTRGGQPYGLIENVVTHPDHRGQGLGKALLDAACARAWSHGCYKVMLSTGSTSPAVLGFYAAAGFAQSRTGFQKRRLPPRVD